MSNLKVVDIMDKTGVSLQTVYRWIDKGYLPAVQVGKGRGAHWEVKEEDFFAFQQSTNYYGDPRSITSTEPFTRVPNIERCYPVNLIRATYGLQFDRKNDEMPDDIWQINFDMFKTHVTQLNDKEQKILMMRYQLGMTLDEVAAAFGLTRERIRQIEVKALRRLRNKSFDESCRIVPKADYNRVVMENEALKKKIENLNAIIDKLEGTVEETKIDPIVAYSEVKIEELDLDVRSYNCLKRRGFNTLGDLFRYDSEQDKFVIESGKKRYYNTWLNIRNYGSKSLSETAKKLFFFCGYRLHEFSPTEGIYVGFVDIPGVPQTVTTLQEVGL